MSKEETKFVPLTELSEHSDDRLTWDVNLLPYVPTDRIGINVDRLKLLSQLAGLKHLRVDSMAGDVSSETIVPNNINAQGTATASVTVARTHAELVKTEVDEDRTIRQNFFSEYHWGNGHITINSAELNKRALEATKKDNGPSLRQPNEWAKLLDRSLTAGITKNAKEQLVGEVSSLSKLYLGIVIFNTMFYLALDPASPSIYPENFLFYSFFFQAASTLVTFLQGHPQERRLSLIPAYQLDRLFAVNAIARTTKLAKVLK